MKRRGRGIACMWYPIGFTVAANPSAAVVKINEDGTATLLTGTVETGQGSLGLLINDKQLYRQLNSTLGEAQGLVADIANGKPVPESAIRNVDLWTA